jgi:hypothetical protein
MARQQQAHEHGRKALLSKKLQSAEKAEKSRFSPQKIRFFRGFSRFLRKNRGLRCR